MIINLTKKNLVNLHIFQVDEKKIICQFTYLKIKKNPARFLIL